MGKMEMQQNLRLSQEMQMLITPQQIMSATILQLQQMNLNMKIRQEVDNNEALELVTSKKENDILVEEKDEAEDLDKDESDIFREYGFDRRYSPDDGVADKRHLIEMTPQRDKTLRQHLLEQLNEIGLSSSEFEIAEIILINLTSDGFLKLDEDGTPLIFKDSIHDEEKIMSVLKIIQQLDPPGIGAASHQESLLLQITRFEGDFPVAEKILTYYYDDLLKNRIPKIASGLGIGIEGVKQAVEIIRNNLTPNPAGEFETEELQYVTPDVIVRDVEGEFEIELNNSNSYNARVSPEFKRRLKESIGEQKEFMRGKLTDASLILRAIEQRRETMLRITKALVQHQREWFEGKRETPVGITRFDIAGDIHMHHSTVSRGVMHKYIQTPRGIFAFSYFFGGSLDVKNYRIDESGEEEKSVKEIKQLMREIIDSEDKKKPLSDSRIRELIVQETGVRVARRTIAKYRESLGILSSSKRKQY